MIWVKSLLIALLVTASFLGILIGLGIGQPSTEKPSFEIADFHDCIVEVSPGRYAGMRFFQLEGAPRTFDAQGRTYGLASSAAPACGPVDTNIDKAVD